MTDATTHYAGFFKAWPKALGSKPTAEMLDNVHNLGARAGKQALAIAMGLRPEGVTNSQIILATGNPQLNKMRGFITDALLKREAAPAGDNGHTVYKLVITKKGDQRIERAKALKAKVDAAGEGEAPAAKPKAKVKAKAKKADKPATPTADTLPKVTPLDGPAAEQQVAEQGQPVNG